MGYWHSTWAVLKAKRESMRKSLGHLLNRQLSRGWGAWLEMAQERGEFMQKLRKGLSYLVNRKLATGFAGWAFSVALHAASEPRPHVSRFASPAPS